MVLFTKIKNIFRLECRQDFLLSVAVISRMTGEFRVTERACLMTSQDYTMSPRHLLNNGFDIG